MKKVKLLTILALSTVALGACSSTQKQTTPKKDKTEQSSKKEDQEKVVKEKVTKDAKILLDSVLTNDSVKFRKVYGETYEKWSDAIIAVQTSERINDDGLKPASTYSVQWHEDFPIETPEETISGFLKVRRKLFQDIGSYDIKDVKVDKSGDSATVTFTSKKLHSKGLASSTRQVLTTLLGGIDNLSKYNRAGADVDPVSAHTPLTTGDFETEIKLEKDKEGNWTISEDDYKTLTSELIDDTEGYDTVVRSKTTPSSSSKSQKTSNGDSV